VSLEAMVAQTLAARGVSQSINSVTIEGPGASGARVAVSGAKPPCHWGRLAPPARSGSLTLPRTSKFRVLTVYRRAPSSVRGVIPQIDIWRVADLMLKRYGDTALVESDRRADELAVAGDTAGVAVWCRIIAAVDQLANTTPPRAPSSVQAIRPDRAPLRPSGCAF
jgi:hypothetical protein